ncbi:MAG: serine/threonine-protein kinase [Planctomycetota bacterium]
MDRPRGHITERLDDDETPGHTEEEDRGDPTLSRYRVVEEIGKGGMGRVLEAQDGSLLRAVALKVIRSREPVEASRFAIEAQITGQLDHPSVLPVYDYGQDRQGNPYFTMKLVRGHRSLADVIESIARNEPSARRWTFRKRVMLIQEVCRALHYAHMRGVVHRDVKPENVVLGGFGEVYLVDWGVARLSGQGQVRPVAVDPQVARVVDGSERDMIVGTPLFMSPEVVAGAPAAARDDVYALVATLFELLCLHHYLVTPSEDVKALAYQIREKKRTAPERFVDPIAGRVPRTLSVICLRGLSRDPADRFQDAKELEEALQAWLEGKNPVICPGTCMQRGMNEGRDLIDQHPVLVPAAVITFGVLFLAWVGYASWVTLSR